MLHGDRSSTLTGPAGQVRHIGIEVETTRGLDASATSHLVRGDRETVRHAALLAALEALDSALERTDLVMHSESTS